MKSPRAFACSFLAVVAPSHANAHSDPHCVSPNVHDPVEMDAAPLERREEDEDTNDEVAADVGIPVRGRVLGPGAPTAAEKDQHERSAHVAYRGWCGLCMQGRGRAQRHGRGSGTQHRLPVSALDYAFLTKRAMKKLWVMKGVLLLLRSGLPRRRATGPL